MGRVWRARDRLLDRDVALKEARGGPGSAAARRLRREGALLGRLDHPGIVALLFRGDRADGRPFLALRIVPGPDLRTWAASAPDLSRRLAVLRALVAALAHAHGRGVVHRDLTPANVRVDWDGTVCVLDWGLGRDVSEAEATPVRPGLTRLGTRLGTPAYMSPEQAAGETVGPAADVWSLGILAWEVLSGRRAYSGRAATEVLAGVLSGPPPRLRTVCPSVPGAVALVVDGALSPLAERPADAGALLAQLDAALRAPTPRPGAGWPLGVAGLVVGLGLGWLVHTPPRPPPEPLDRDRIAQWLTTGDYDAVRTAACARLADVPDDPLARGLMLHADRWPELLWTAPVSACDIGEELRWDGRYFACANSDGVSVYEVTTEGVTPLWSRPDEVHQLQFAADDQLVVWAAGLDFPLRLDVRTGRKDPIEFSVFRDAQIYEGRARTEFVGRVGDEVVWYRVPEAVFRQAMPGVPIPQEIHRFPAAGMKRAVVLADGSLLAGFDAHVEWRPDPLAAPTSRWPLPSGMGTVKNLIVASSERHVGVLTSDEVLLVLDRKTGTWSSALPVPAVYFKLLSVSPDGRLLASSATSGTRVRSTDSPEREVLLPRGWIHPRFLDAQTLLVHRHGELSTWRMPDSLRRPELSLQGKPRGLELWQGGTVGWSGRSGRWWRDAGSQPIELSPLTEAVASPDGARLAVARDQDGVTVLEADGSRRDFPRPICRWVAWADDDSLVCVGSRSGPDRLDVATGAVDRSHGMADHRWADISSRAGTVAVVDWDARVYTLTERGLTERTRAAWLTRVEVAGSGELLLLNARRGIIGRDWLSGARSDPDRVVTPTGYRSFNFSVSPDGDRVAVVEPTGGLTISDVETGRVEVIVPAEAGTVAAVAWFLDGRSVVVALADGRLLPLQLGGAACLETTAPGGADTTLR